MIRRAAGTSARWLEAERGWRVEVPKHRDRHLWRYGLEEKPRGFQVIPRRWVVERTFAWLSRSRRLARDYERLLSNDIRNWTPRDTGNWTPG